MVTESRPRGALIAAGVVGVIVLLGIVGMAVGLFDGDDAAPSGGPTPAPSNSGTPSACGLPDGEFGPLNTAPQTEWRLSGRVAAPYSKALGPGRETRQIHSCFAHSSEGAVVAAANFAVDLVTTGLDAESFVKARVDPTSAGFNDFLMSAREGEQDTGGGVQIAGFRVDSGTPEAATVQLVFESTEGPSSGALTAITYSLVWVGGDWLIQAPPAGALVASEVESLSGYVEWSGT